MLSHRVIDPPPTGGQEFASTHWSVVLSAGRGDDTVSREALAKLCRTYWYPLYAFVRRRGNAPEEAEDLTQDFFAYFLEKECVQRVDPQRGRFRAFLLSSLRHFLENEWDKRRAVKRGGRCRFVSWEELGAETRYRLEPFHDLSADKLYDRRWAMRVIENAMATLRKEHESGEELAVFDALHAHLSDGAGTETYQQLAARLDLSEAAVKMRVLRLRRRFGELLRIEVAQTVTGPVELEEEMRHLLAAWD